MYHANSAPRAAGEPRDVPDPPPGLSDDAAEVWRALLGSWVLGAEERLILRGALEAWDLYQETRAQLRREGSVLVAESGSVKRHPAALVARDAFREYRDAIRQLGLESELPTEEG